MVIVEGPDGSGKSTLVSRLCEAFQTDIMERPCTSDNAIDMRTLRDWVDRDLSGPVHGFTLYDRHPLISEPIYGPIIRGRMADGFSDLIWLSRSMAMLEAKEPTVIYCIPPWPAVQHNVVMNHERTTEHLRGVLERSQALYEQYVHRAVLAVVRQPPRDLIWDYTTGNFDWLRKHLAR